jgi:hypothetical protein
MAQQLQARSTPSPWPPPLATRRQSTRGLRQAVVAYDFRGEHEPPSPMAVTVATAERAIRREMRLSYDQIAARRSEALHALVPHIRVGQGPPPRTPPPQLQPPPPPRPPKQKPASRLVR